MAEEDTSQMSVKDRIAALKLSQVGRQPTNPATPYDQVTNGTTWTKKPPPPPPSRPAVPPRPKTSNVPALQDHVSANGGVANQPEGDRFNSNGMDGITRPALPPRTSTQSSQGPTLPPRKPSEPSPALPPRRPSETPSQSDYRLSRRGSNESVSSVATARSSVSGMSVATSVTSQDRYSIRAPAYDPNALPPLPPKRTEAEKQAYYDSGNKSARRPLKATHSSPNVGPKQNGTTPPPARRPSAQQGPALSRTTTSQEQPQRRIELPPPPRPNLAEPPKPRRSALEMGMNTSNNDNPPVLPARSTSVPQTNGCPPPVPTTSRPDLAALQASKPKLNGAATSSPAATAGSCLHCRDFSAPDAHAARFPRQSVPNQDVGWLAQQLTAPFSSATDKARAIFTWGHHNIAYDTKNFFAGTVKPSTPQSTISSGLAVCEGYAGLFAALALKAGLEAFVISGHSKGFGYSALKLGQPLPTYNAGHAWNAVKIDGEQWKLVDPCWGAGALGGDHQYNAKFAPERFTQSNDEFGLDHFPGDSSKQFRNDGRVVAWEEYILGNKRVCGADFFSGYTISGGISETSFKPVNNPIVLAQQGPIVRFSFQKVCPHWDPVRNGKGGFYLYDLAVDNLEGTPNNHIPFETNGEVWWCDIPTRDLGRAGQTVKVLAVATWKGKDGAGLTAKEYKEAKGRHANYSWSFVAKWTLA